MADPVGLTRETWTITICSHGRATYWHEGIGWCHVDDAEPRGCGLNPTEVEVQPVASGGSPPSPWNPDAEHPQHRDYIATNLLHALSRVPDTGDWHGELRGWCERNMTGEIEPNPWSQPSLPAEPSPEAIEATILAASRGVDGCDVPGVGKCGGAHTDCYYRDLLRAAYRVDSKEER